MTTSTDPNPARSVFGRFMRLLGSVRTGMIILTCILVYASIGSGVAPVRGALEMTETQVFEHWLFVALIILFCACLVVASLTRIRWSWRSAGALITHAGLLMLIGGSWWYFANKVEGDVLLITPRVEVLTGSDHFRPIGQFPAEAGESWQDFLPAFGGPVQLTLESIEGYPDGPDARATLLASINKAEQRVVLTPNAAPRPLGNGLFVRWRTFAEQTRFYDDQPALYWAKRGQAPDGFLPLAGLPLHRERYLPGEGTLSDCAGRPVPSKRTWPHLRIFGLTIPTGWFEPWRLGMELKPPDLPFTVRVTGYLPYVAELRRSTTGGQLAEQPVIEPLQRRRPNLGRSASAIRLRIGGRGPYEGWRESLWCLFSEYPHLDSASAVPGLAARPTIVRLPDGTEYELIYSRVERELGAALIPGRLRVKFFPGRRGAESWRSDFYVRYPGQPASRPGLVRTNQTMRLGRWTLFQSGAPRDHWSWTILGVGNRRGIWPMTAGSILVTLGCLYAFYVKPILRRRAVPQSASKNGSARASRLPAAGVSSLVAAALITASASAAEPFAASSKALALDRQVDWSRAALIVVQDGGRYKTLDSFARESMAAMYGREHLPGLTPLASLCEWLFNREAYADTPVIRIRDRGLRMHLTDRMPEAARQRIVQTGYLTPRELVESSVQERLIELEPRFELGRSIERVRRAEAVARFIDELIRIVPRPNAPADAAWYTPMELRTNAALALEPDQRPSTSALLRQFGPPAPDVTPEQAVPIVACWLELEQAWKRADAAAVQQHLDRLAALLPELAAPGVYPAAAQRRAESRYYANFIGTGLFSRASLGWVLYLVGGLVSVLALVTGWRKPWLAALALLVGAMAWHAYGLSLRWYVVGRIPVANMFEAITASAWVGIALALVVELLYRTRLYLLAAHATGFFALVVASYALPRLGSSGGEITTIMGILDDIMLRIHTVLIIAAYALIFLAAVIAAAYLFGYYFHTNRRTSLQMGLFVALLGLLARAAFAQLATDQVVQAENTSAPATGGAQMSRAELVRWGAAGAAAVCAFALALLAFRRGPKLMISATILLLVTLLTLIIGRPGMVKTVGATLLGSGAAWSLLNLGGYLLSGKKQPAQAAALPVWLDQADWSHLIILHMAFVLLFAGIILGAVWADYSWGRPWGWDPKETFALNTWIIYAILIHVRFIVRQRGLWTAWLSIAGCGMMAFNWFVVNFYIVGLHSYA